MAQVQPPLEVSEVVAVERLRGEPNDSLVAPCGLPGQRRLATARLADQQAGAVIAEPAVSEEPDGRGVTRVAATPHPLGTAETLKQGALELGGLRTLALRRGGEPRDHPLRAPRPLARDAQSPRRRRRSPPQVSGAYL